MIILDELCKKLKEARLSNEMTQKELAKMMHVSDAQISNWENGKYKESHLGQISKGLIALGYDIHIKVESNTCQHCHELHTDFISGQCFGCKAKVCMPCMDQSIAANTCILCEVCKRTNSAGICANCKVRICKKCMPAHVPVKCEFREYATGQVPA